MSSEPNTPLAEQITAEACAWVAQLETGDLSRADVAALKEWVSRSPAHAAEIRSVAELSGQMGELTGYLQLVEQARIERGRVRRKPQRPKLAATFAALAVIVGAFIFATGRYGEPPVQVLEFSTLTGEYETHTLSDGSVIRLNTNTQLSVEYSSDSRAVTMAFGEALFEVASDPSRPFIVMAGSSQSEALGTSFSVRLLDEVAELSVVEGVVAFSKSLRNQARSTAEHSPARVVLNAGQSISLQTTEGSAEPVRVEQIRTVSDRELMRQLSWTEGLLEFSDTPLREVVEEVNRHIQTPLQIEDARLYDLRLGGIYRAGDRDAMLEAFERLGIEVDQSSRSYTVLRLREQSEDRL